MASIRILRTTSLFAVAATTSVALAPRRTAWAEAPVYDDLPKKKPIYASPQNTPRAALDSKPPGQITDPLTTNPPTHPPTPTDRLATQIGHARLFLHRQAATTESHIDALLAWAFRQETNIADTIASLAPKPETGEQLLPGAIYVLVATMAGSIVARNRGLILRTATPVAVGVAAGQYLIPVTMGNVGDLLWEYEKKVPGVSETHALVGGAVRQAVNEVRSRSQGTVQWADKEVTRARKAVEEFVGEGR